MGSRDLYTSATVNVLLLIYNLCMHVHVHVACYIAKHGDLCTVANTVHVRYAMV